MTDGWRNAADFSSFDFSVEESHCISSVHLSIGIRVPNNHYVFDRRHFTEHYPIRYTRLANRPAPALEEQEEEEEEAPIDFLSEMTQSYDAHGACVCTCVGKSCISFYYNIPLVVPVNEPMLPTIPAAFSGRSKGGRGTRPPSGPKFFHSLPLSYPLSPPSLLPY